MAPPVLVVFLVLFGSKLEGHGGHEKTTPAGSTESFDAQKIPFWIPPNGARSLQFGGHQRRHDTETDT